MKRRYRNQYDLLKELLIETGIVPIMAHYYTVRVILEGNGQAVIDMIRKDGGK